jgi:hypothetical protein
MEALLWLLALAGLWVLAMLMGREYSPRQERKPIPMTMRRSGCQDQECWLRECCDAECLGNFKVGGTD